MDIVNTWSAHPRCLTSILTRSSHHNFPLPYHMVRGAQPTMGMSNPGSCRIGDVGMSTSSDAPGAAQTPPRQIRGPRCPFAAVQVAPDCFVCHHKHVPAPLSPISKGFMAERLGCSRRVHPFLQPMESLPMLTYSQMVEPTHCSSTKLCRRLRLPSLTTKMRQRS